MCSRGRRVECARRGAPDGRRARARRSGWKPRATRPTRMRWTPCATRVRARALRPPYAPPPPLFPPRSAHGRVPQVASRFSAALMVASLNRVTLLCSARPPPPSFVLIGHAASRFSAALIMHGTKPCNAELPESHAMQAPRPPAPATAPALIPRWTGAWSPCRPPDRP